VSIDRTDPVLSRRDAWHQSTLETLLDGCSWQYFLTYELNVPGRTKPASVSGIAYHAAIEAHEKGRASGADVPLSEMLAIAEQSVRGTLDDDHAVEEAKHAVRHWYGTPTKDGGPSHREWLLDYEAVAIEPYFKLDLVEGAKPIAGWIDGVYRHKQTGDICLVDHKTANNFSRWGHGGDEHRAQATMYATALVISPDYHVNDLVPMHYLVSRKTKGRGATFEGARRVTVQPILEDVRVLGDRVRAAEKLVADEGYVRRPEWVLCKPEWCPHYENCMVTGDLAGTPTQVRKRLTVPL
jgi:hypothetical protein